MGIAPIKVLHNNNNNATVLFLFCCVCFGTHGVVVMFPQDYLTPLHVAAHCGNVKTAKLLLDRKCEPNARALVSHSVGSLSCQLQHVRKRKLALSVMVGVAGYSENRSLLFVTVVVTGFLENRSVMSVTVAVTGCAGKRKRCVASIYMLWSW